MIVFTRAAFSALFLAVFFSLPAVVAEREAEAGKKARPQVDGVDLPRPDSQQTKVIKEGKQNLDEIRRMLDEIQKDLAGKKTGGATQKQQKAVVEKMNQLIEKIAEECSRCNSGGSGQSQQASQSSSQQKQGKDKKPGQGAPRKNQDQVKSSRQQQEAQQQKEQQAKKADGKDGKEQPGQVENNKAGDGQKPDNSSGELADRVRKGKKWGLLPPKIRDAIGSVTPKTAPSEYLEIIRSYYRRISEQYAEGKK
ncbi:MAG: hypothetical protein VX288_03885 [Planctomycetota bacterium]|nr:hypothetical protein [Planctomycetota bacterium]